MKAAIYVRVSTADQAERWSLPAQRRALIEFADRQGWEYDVYEDAGISGETLDGRPAMLRLLDDARHGRICAAVAIEMERFSRSESLFDWLVIKQAFRHGKVKFGTPAQLYDSADTEDDFLTDLFGALAKREKRKIIERTRRGRLEAARKGKFVCSRVPLGYQRVAKAAVDVDPQGARIVRAIFSMAARALSTRGICRALLERGVPTPRGLRVWNLSTVARILRNPSTWGRGVSTCAKSFPPMVARSAEYAGSPRTGFWCQCHRSCRPRCFGGSKINLSGTRSCRPAARRQRTY